MSSALIYLHGFCSSPASWKAKLLGQTLAELGLADRYDCPVLSPVPAEAIEQISALIAQRKSQNQPPVLIGSSLGGYYAHALAKRHGLKAILINPVVWSSIDPSRFLGSQQNYHNGESFEFTQQHINQLAALDTSIDHPERYLLMVETGDEVLNAEHALQHYAACPKTIVPGGEHGFASFGEQITKVLAFCELTELKITAMYSQRFNRPIILTRHAKIRMAERCISDEMLLEVIDQGQTRFRDDTHLWAFKSLPERDDNLLCAVLVLENELVVKTVMHHFQLL